MYVWIGMYLRCDAGELLDGNGLEYEKPSVSDLALRAKCEARDDVRRTRAVHSPRWRGRVRRPLCSGGGVEVVKN